MEEEKLTKSEEESRTLGEHLKWNSKNLNKERVRL